MVVAATLASAVAAALAAALAVPAAALDDHAQVRRNLLASLAHDVGDAVRHVSVVLVEAREGVALGAGAARPPDSVHVVLDRQRKGVVDNELDVLHIEAAARHIRGNEGRLLASLEVRDRLCSGVLRHVTLQGACLRVALLLEEALEPRRFLLVQTEDDDLLVRRIVRLQDGEKPAGLVLVVVQHLNLLPNRGVRDKALVHRADADMHRVLQELRRQGMN
mmetsp:Transcript_114537/g.318565  ORF Transcript_114537/g.318565 Transcript_114537/m.318565 type:complete len:220 (-) Transcript_114537:679-1338(-)